MPSFSGEFTDPDQSRRVCELSEKNALLQCLQVIGEKLFNQLNHPISMVGPGGIIRLLFEHRQGISDGNRESAQRQERNIIFSITDANDSARRKLQFA